MSGAELGPFATLKLATRMLVRDWRAGEQRLLALALTLAVASVTTVAFFVDRVDRSLRTESNQLLGADLVVVSDHPIDTRFVQSAERMGLAWTTAVRFPSMTQFGGRPLLTEGKAVGAGNPLRGQARTRLSEQSADVEPRRIPAMGEVWVDDRLLRRLALKI